MAAPGWQTGELVEEWVESSPSPPTATQPLPPVLTETLPTLDAESIRAKRGSLRALGHAAARALPSRSASTSSPRIVSGHSEGRVLSERLDNLPTRSASTRTNDLPSPPSSSGENEPQVTGTFVVKEGVDDDRGKHLARNKGGRDMFGPTALEKMFQPPSPPAETPQELPQPQPHQSSTPSPSTSPVDAVRRASHPYAPTNPSRLSKSVTPSTASGSGSSFSASQPIEFQDIQNDSANASRGEEDEDISHEYEIHQSQEERHDASHSAEVQSGFSPIASGERYPFTFEAPVPPTSHPVRAGGDDPSNPFDPALSPFNYEEASHSTLQRQASPQRRYPSKGKGAGNPGLRLFRSTYDTYTREHLSALVDSIAIEPSPSPPPSIPNAQDLREWSPDASPSYSGGSRSHSDKSASRASDESEDVRSSKRMRMSPSSPARRPPGVRDWGAQGRAMMERIRGREMESQTSASASASASISRQSCDVEEDEAVNDYVDIPPSPPLVTRYSRADRPTHRSNPSTTSSGYLRAAEDLMAKIKARVVSESGSASAMDQSPGSTGTRLPSVSSSEWEAAAAQAMQKGKGKGKPVGPSPRRILRRLSASEEIKRAAGEGSSGEDDGEQGAGPDKVRLAERRPTSQASSGTNRDTLTARQNHNLNGGGQVNADDLNRFVSATTIATGTTMSTSFVKHAGPRQRPSQAGGGMRVIKPDDINGLVPDRVGRMRFDKASMRWVKEGLGRVDEGTESRGSRSRSAESEDVFAGMDSWGRSDGRRPSLPVEPIVQTQGENESSASEVDEEENNVDDEEAIRNADTTQIVDDLSDSESDSSRSDVELQHHRQLSSPSRSPPKESPPTRPTPHHASSAPAIMTPTPNLSAPPRPIRSALRNTNSLTPGMKKRAQWHESVTPAAGSSARRSVSFSDGKKSGKIRELHTETTPTEQRDGRDLMDDRDGEWFRSKEGGEGKSWLPSVRTKRIEGILGDLEELSLDDGTPSKPPRPLIDSPEQAESEGDTTIQQADHRHRSFRAAADANATFLTECSFGVTHDRLVQLITDVYGSEPYWEHLKVLDLRGKGADSVARLKEFLPDLDEVNLNDNKISYLSGIPSGVRSLHVASNRLSSLSSVDHLRNLQYLDISKNQLDSVSQLTCLRHLRELKADGNFITDLTGLMEIDCLIKLSVAKNKLTEVDLARTKWHRLENLNLSNNKIEKIYHLEKLSALRELTLDDNQLSDLKPSQAMASIRAVRISDNHLASLDLSLFPRLRTLYADRNALKTLNRSITGLSRLENLSLRNQRVTGLHLSHKELDNVRRLYISGNPLSDRFFPSAPLYALVYLEAAACNISRWPSDFAQRIPNLKILNLNYNYVENLNGLSGMVGLRKVSVVGARLGAKEGKGVMKGLKGLTNLEEVDLRMNPSTLGFYLPLVGPTSKQVEEPPSSPPPRQNPLPSVTLAVIRPPSVPDTGVEWAALDGQFRRSLPDEWYGKRLVYRGLIMGQCPRLRVLDGVRIEEGERKKAGKLLEVASGGY